MTLILIITIFVLYKQSRTKLFPRRNQKRARPSLGKARQPFDLKSAKPQTGGTVIEGNARIVDGDTIVIKNTQVRLFGIDAPELNHPFGQKAKWALVSLCKGQIIKAEISEKDEYGRVVARCLLQDGTDLSAEMVKLGLAIDWPKFSGGRYQRLETSDARKKLWLADARQKGRMHVWEKFNSNSKTNRDQ